MLCISTSSNLYMPIRGPKTKYAEGADGKMIVLEVKPALAVQFAKAGEIPPHAKEAVSKMPGFNRGMGREEDPFSMCGIFDSVIAAAENNWDDEERQEVENALQRVQGLSFVIVDAPKAAKPWPAYDKVSPDDEAEAAYAISKKVVEDEYNPFDVKQYEVENKNRPLVVEALDLLIADQEKDVLGVIPA